MWGKRDALTYINTGKDKVKNEFPVISEEGVFSTPPADQYKKGSLFLNTLRSVINDDDKWHSLLHRYYQHFKYQTIMTTDMVAFFNQRTGLQLRPIFDQYLRHAAIPTLELRFEDAHTVSYRWLVQEKQFAMPVRVGLKNDWQIITPTSAWQRMRTNIAKDDFEVATDLYYINVSQQ
jgi:aminopeptidase N